MTGEGGFAARTGHEHVADLAADRPHQVAQAWESLLQIRRLTQPGHPDVPATWERAKPMQAVGLALEAKGIEFCLVDDQDAVEHTGVQLALDTPGVVRIISRHRRGERPADAGEARLRTAAEALAAIGWDALLYRAGRNRYLLAEPGRIQ